MQADAVHHTVHDEGRAGQVARILQKRNEQVEDHDLRQEDDHRTHAADRPVDEHVAQGAVGQQGIDAATDPTDQRIDPLLRIGPEAERAPEHEPHEGEEDRESPQLVGHEGIDKARGRHLLALPRGVGLTQRSLDETVFLVGERSFDILTQRLADPAGLDVAQRDPLAIVRAATQSLLDLSVALKELHGVIAGREGLRQLASVVAQRTVQAAQPLLDHRTHVDVNVPHAVVAVLEDVDHRVEQGLDAAVIARLDGHHRHAEHASQIVVVELRTASLQLVVHIQGHNHARVDVDQFGRQVEVALEVRGHHRVDDHVGGLFGNVAAHETLLGRIGRQGVGSREIGHLEAVAAVGAETELGTHRHAAVVAHMLVAARDGIEERRLAAVGIADQRHGDRPARAGDHLVHRRAGSLIRRTSARFALGIGFGPAAGLTAAPLLLGEKLARLGIGDDNHHVGLAAPERNVVTHDFVFDRVLERSVQNHLDTLAAHKAHLHDAAAEPAVPRHLDDRCRFAGLQFG